MFDQSFIHPDKRTGQSLPFTASLILQCALVALIILLSVLRPQTIHSEQFNTLLLAPRAPVAPHSPQVSTSGRPTPLLPRHLFVIASFRPATPRAVTHESTPAEAPDLGTPTGSDVSGIPLPGLLQPSSRPSSPQDATETRSKPTSQTATSTATGPTSISQGVAQANLIHQVLPEYPRLAVVARVQGSVHFRAIISQDGRVTGLELLAGHPLLIAAARAAVLEWRYRPTRLNGVPVPVVTDIEVNFKLADAHP